MWEHRCQHENRNGTQCRRKSTIAVWAFNHRGMKLDSASWDEYCAWHYTDATSVVSMMEI